MSVLNNSNAISTGGAYNLESSLRLRESASAYLSRTPTSTGDRQKFTISTWVKFSKQNSSIILNSGNTTSDRVLFRFSGTNGQFHVIISDGGTNYAALSNAYLRDPSAWYHLVLAIDTTQATSTNRIKGYINGEEITSWSSYSVPAQNYNMHINLSGTIMAIGADSNASTYQSDAYYSEYNFIDGQQLTPSDFGETDTITGVWKPKEYTGTYGTNGFYLPMKETQQATGFNTVLYTGNGGTQSISNVGFSPDLVWMKARNYASGHALFDTVRGATEYLGSETTSAELTLSTTLTSFDSDGFSLGSATGTNRSGYNFVAWCWDAGSSTVSNTDGSITSTVRANPATGFSIVTYTGNGTASTIGHGLGTAPSVIILKQRIGAAGDLARQWVLGHNSLGWTKSLKLSTTDAELTSTPIWNDTTPTSSVFTIGNSNTINYTNSTYVAYCFSEVAGFSKFGSYTGNGTTSNAITGLGFSPAWLMVKRTNSTGNWHIVDNTRVKSGELRANLSNAEAGGDGGITFTSDGFTLDESWSDINASGGTYIYMAFADTRDAQFNFDASGNKNNWTANNINSNASSETTYDIMNDVATLTDEDTANFAVLNPLNNIPYGSVSDGNLKFTGGANWSGVYSSIKIPSTGKWYAECVVGSTTSNSNQIIFGFQTFQPLTFTVTNFYGHGHNNGFFLYNNGTASTNGGFTTPTGTLLQIAIDADAGKAWYGYNNNWYDTYNTTNGDPSAGTNPYATGINFSTSDFYFVLRSYVNNGSINFGQRPFKYTPPTGFKKLNTYNLPDSTIADGSQYFITNTFTGTGSTLSINTGFSPDFVWLKSRSFADHPLIYDSIRGANKRLYSSLTNAESTATNQLNSFDSDGYTLGSDASGQINVSGQTSVGWSWRGSDSSAVSNTDGTITSTVSANTTSGFSVVTYTGTGASATVGHGLGSAPQFIIFKDRDTATDWAIYTDIIDGSYDQLRLNTTAAATATGIGSWNSSTINFSSGSSVTNVSGSNYVCYAFHSVEGFSKFGSYTGNGSADGPFIYTGFRPAFVMFKRTNSTSNWSIIDATRNTYNVVTNYLDANVSNAEASNFNWADFTSNGFKLRATNATWNASGSTYIYMAFAENPFKQSLAR